MDALVSGQAGIAILVQGTEALLVSMDALDSEFVCSPNSIPYLLDGTSDVVELKAVSKETAILQLQLAWKFDRALHLILILVDGEEESETRMMAAECIPDLVVDRQVREDLENLLYSCRIPNTQGLKESRRFFSPGNGFPDFLEELDRSQGVIETIRRRWDELPVGLFENPTDKEAFRAAAVQSGVFKLLAKSSRDPSSLNLAILESYAKLKSLRNYRAILGNWLTPLKPEKVPHEARDTDQAEDDPTQEDLGKGRPPARVPSAFEAFENVKKQKEAIIPLLGKGDLSKVRKFVEELVQSQLRPGGAKFATMSLCDLAQHAKNVCNFSLQLEFAKRAVDLSSDDGWANGQLADAYFGLGQYDNALHFFNLAAIYGHPAFAKTGQARILWGQGRLEEALAVYDQAISEFPTEPFPWYGRAEILREMWRYEEALAIYDEAIERFPSESAPRCGKAAVLKDLGRLVDALQAYSDAIRNSPQEAVPRDGRGDVLKEMGLLDEALDAYNENIALSSEDSVARCGRAEVLSAMGRFDEALQAYAETIEDFPYVPVPYCGRAEVLRDMGRLEESLEFYNAVIRKFPFEARAHTGRANILKRLGRFSESLQAYDQTIKDFPFDIFALSGRADLLKELGKLQDALDAYNGLIRRNPVRPNLRHAKAAILVAMHRFEEAEKLLPINTPETRDDWIAYHIRGMILLRKDMLGPAIQHLKKGLDSIPFADERKYFQNALAVATLRQRQYNEAAHYLEGSREPITEALRIHVFGELRRPVQASQAYSRLLTICPPNLVPLRDELAAQYRLVNSLPCHDMQWIFEEECQNVLLEAA
jgi:tetratricopeptide (TPR) repeat protein